MSSTDTPTEQEADTVVVDTARNDLLARLTAHLGDGLVDSHLVPDSDLTIRVTRDVWVEAGSFLKTGLGFQYFSFLSGIDWLPSPFGRDMDAQVDLAMSDEAPDAPDDTIEQGVAGGETRFQVFARVNDIVNGFGVTLKVDLPDDDLSVPTWVDVYAGANWHEREAWEMYGITFTGHPGLRHIYLPGDFEGNPLRKDYPLLARRMKPWPGIVDVEQMPEVSESDAAPAAPDSSGSEVSESDAAPAAPGKEKSAE